MKISAEITRTDYYCTEITPEDLDSIKEATGVELTYEDIELFWNTRDVDRVSSPISKLTDSQWKIVVSMLMDWVFECYSDSGSDSESFYVE